MGLHRNTLMIWESPDTQVDVIRQARYRKALRALVAEKLAAESKR